MPLPPVPLFAALLSATSSVAAPNFYRTFFESIASILAAAPPPSVSDP